MFVTPVLSRTIYPSQFIPSFVHTLRHIPQLGSWAIKSKWLHSPCCLRVPKEGIKGYIAFAVAGTPQRRGENWIHSPYRIGDGQQMSICEWKRPKMENELSKCDKNGTQGNILHGKCRYVYFPYSGIFTQTVRNRARPRRCRIRTCRALGDLPTSAACD